MLSKGALTVTPLVLLPLVVVVVALAFRRHMLEAGILGAIVAMLLGKVGIPAAVDVIMKAIPGMLGTLTPLFYCSVAIVVAKNGGFENLLKLVRRLIGNRMPLVAAAIVLIQGLATYAAGLGAGNTMVTAPLALAAVGAVPEMIAGMAIATAASFETSPASAESALASKLAGVPVGDYSEMMRPYTYLFWALGIALAAWGVWRRGRILKTQEATESGESTGTLFKLALPTLYLITVVVAGKGLNGMVGWNLFSPVFNVLTTLLLVGICVPGSAKKLSENLIEGSSFILTRLFAVGLFLGFVNIFEKIGTFQYIANLAISAPTSILVATAALAGFLVSIAAGAYTVGVIALVVPAMAQAGLSPTQIGLVCIAIGFGSQVSLVQINVASLGLGFKMDIPDVVKNNFRYIPIALAVLLGIAFFA